MFLFFARRKDALTAFLLCNARFQCIKYNLDKAIVKEEEHKTARTTICYTYNTYTMYFLDIENNNFVLSIRTWKKIRPLDLFNMVVLCCFSSP